MTALDRRRFLVLGAAGLAGAAWGRTGDEGAAEAFGREWLRGELETARGMGKPLLVLLIPTRPDAEASAIHGHPYPGWTDQGELFGTFLNHADSAQMAPLALAHVVCAFERDARDVLAAESVLDEPTMVVVETDGDEPARWIAFDPSLGRFWHPGEEPRDWLRRDRIAALEDLARRRNAALGERLRQLLAGDLETYEARAGRSAQVLDAADLERLKANGNAALLDFDLVDRAAAWLAHEAVVLEGSGRADDRARRKAIEMALTAAATKRLREAAPPGSQWAIRDSCDAWFEGDQEASRHPCGMAHVPPLGRRFLSLFAPR